MITKAIVEQVIDNGYHAKVRIPIYHKLKGSATATPDKELPTASICCEPGSVPALKKGDIVFVDFEEDIISQPIIIGMLFRAEDTSKTNLRVGSLNVDINANLPEDTIVGTTLSKDFNNLKNTAGNLQAQITLLEQRLSVLEKGGSSTNPPTTSDLSSLYVSVNQTITNFTENTNKDDWGKLYYADITIPQAKTTMIAKVMVDTEKTSKKESDYITACNILQDGYIRIYFSEKPSSYTIYSVQLLTCKEV